MLSRQLVATIEARELTAAHGSSTLAVAASVVNRGAAMTVRTGRGRALVLDAEGHVVGGAWDGNTSDGYSERLSNGQSWRRTETLDLTGCDHHGLAPGSYSVVVEYDGVAAGETLGPTSRLVTGPVPLTVS